MKKVKVTLCQLLAVYAPVKFYVTLYSDWWGLMFCNNETIHLDIYWKYHLFILGKLITTTDDIDTTFTQETWTQPSGTDVGGTGMKFLKPLVSNNQFAKKKRHVHCDAVLSSSWPSSGIITYSKQLINSYFLSICICNLTANRR